MKDKMEKHRRFLKRDWTRGLTFQSEVQIVITPLSNIMRSCDETCSYAAQVKELPRRIKVTL